MVSLHFSELRLLSFTGEPLEAPPEWSLALIEVCRPVEERNRLRLLVQGKPVSLRVEERFGKDRILAGWERASTGNYRLQLEGVGFSCETTWRVLPSKISQSSYAALVDDLEARLPVSIAMGLMSTGGMTGLTVVAPRANTLAEELTRLRRVIDGIAGERLGFAAALSILAKDHHRVLAQEEIWAQRHQVRRPLANRLSHALCRAANLHQSGSVLLALDARARPTVDVYENRLVKLLAYHLHLRLRRLCSALEARASEAPLMTAKSLRARLDLALRSATFLEEVRLPAFALAHVTMVLLKLPAYQSVLEAYFELHRSLAVQLDETAIDAPLDNLPRLYELWGSLSIIEALLAYGQTQGFRTERQRLVRMSTGDLYVRVLPDGEPALVLLHPGTGTRVTLRIQASFGKSGHVHSVSFEQRPDVTIEVDAPNLARRILIFDPKYKLQSEIDELGNGTPKKQDIDKMHAYRDAICTSDGNRPVKFAGILYPGHSQKFGGIGALNAVPGNHEPLRTELHEIFAAHIGACAAPAPGIYWLVGKQ
jgi:hypothetical protein